MIEEKNNKEEINLSGVIIGAPNSSGGSAEFQKKELSPNQIFNPEMSKMVKWVIKYSGGLIKSEKQANYFLIGFVTLAIIVALSLFFGMIGGSSKSKNPGIETFKNAPPEMIPRNQ